MLIVIDDKEIFRTKWLKKMKPDFSERIGFSHPKAFANAIDNNEIKPEDIDLIVIDRKNGRFDALIEDFANSFREMYPLFSGSIVLSSALHEENEKPIKGFNLITNKCAHRLDDLTKMMKEHKKCENQKHYS